MITFKKLRWKNFLSTGNQYTEINFTLNSTNLIIGTNGAGKSTVLDALTFSLFGKPFRKINKAQLIKIILFLQNNPFTNMEDPQSKKIWFEETNNSIWSFKFFVLIVSYFKYLLLIYISTHTSFKSIL